MTYTTTHLGIATIVLYYLSPKSAKQYFKEHPKTFFLLTLGTIMPDLDLLTSGHRAYGHSIFFPLILLVISSYLPRLNFDHPNFVRNLRYFSLFWLAHLIYDTTFGPVAYFWPLDPRFYDIDMGIRINLEGNGILPVTIAGFFMNVDIIDQETGVRTFFVNWTPEERISAFGQAFLNFSVPDFMVHTTIFSWYIIVVILPLLKNVLNNIRQRFVRTNLLLPSWNSVIQWYYNSKLTHLINNKQSWLAIGFLLLLSTSFFIAGPYYERQWIDQNRSGSQFYVLNDNLRLLGSKEYKVPTSSQFSVTMKISQDEMEFSVFALLLTKSEANEIKQGTRELINLYEEGNLTFSTFVLTYQSYIANISQITPDHVKTVSNTTTTEWRYDTENDAVLLSGLYSWNSSLSFIVNAEYNAQWVIDRNDQYRTGLLLWLITLTLAIIELFRLLIAFREKSRE